MKKIVLWAILIVSALGIASCTSPDSGPETEQNGGQAADAETEILSPAFVLFYTEN